MKSADPFYDIPITARDLKGAKAAFTDICRSMLQQHQFQLLQSKKRQRVQEDSFSSDTPTTETIEPISLPQDLQPELRSPSKRIETLEKSPQRNLRFSESTSSASSLCCSSLIPFLTFSSSARSIRVRRRPPLSPKRLSALLQRRSHRYPRLFHLSLGTRERTRYLQISHLETLPFPPLPRGFHGFAPHSRSNHAHRRFPPSLQTPNRRSARSLHAATNRKAETQSETQSKSANQHTRSRLCFASPRFPSGLGTVFFAPSRPRFPDGFPGFHVFSGAGGETGAGFVSDAGRACRAVQSAADPHSA